MEADVSAIITIIIIRPILLLVNITVHFVSLIVVIIASINFIIGALKDVRSAKI